MSMKIEGLDKAIADIVRAERQTVTAARSTVKKFAAIMADQAQQNAPIKDGYLESSIGILSEEVTPTQYIVEIGPDVSKLGPGYTQHGFDYSEKMHDGDYNLGPRSQAKAGAGNEVGPKYMERAALQHEQALLEELKLLKVKV